MVPPYVSAEYPPLGVPVLAGACSARGLRVRQVYGNLLLAARLGYDTYAGIGRIPLTAQIGERLFVEHAYAPQERARLSPGPPLAPTLRPVFAQVTGEIGAFLAELTDEILACRPRVVGVSTNFQQNLAAISIARAVKQAQPDIRVVLGGANVSDPMGPALARLFPWIDHFFAGEADIEFPAFCERVLAGDPAPAPQVVQCEPIADMARVSAPDFGDYYAALRGYQREGRLPDRLPRMTPLESSRGCWWGAKHHCTFCGLNGEEMGFRAKPAERVLAEIAALASAWAPRRIQFTDNIMPLGHLAGVFPAMEAMTPRPSLFYEVKANLRDDQLDAMIRGGVASIQPGIELFSSHTLRLMRKGVSGPQNIALLRACRSRGLDVVWNYLYGFPGELAADYEAALRLLPWLEHLQPPGTVTRISMDRYSPYHASPEAFGVPALIPFEGYAGLYPADAPIEDIAYHFWGDHETAFMADRALVGAFHAGIETWRARWRAGPPLLRLLDRGGSQVAVADTRAVAASPLVSLSRQAEQALRHFERPRANIGHAPEIAAEIEALVQLGFLVEHDGRLLSVVIRPAPETQGADAAIGGQASVRVAESGHLAAAAVT